MQRSAFLKLAATTTFAAGTRLAFPWAAAAANRPVRFRGALYRAGGKGRIQTSVNGGRSWKLHSNIGGMYSIKRLTVHNGRPGQAVVAHALTDLRPVTPDDRDFLLRVYASTREEELRLVDWSAEQKEAFVRQQFEVQDAYYREHYHPVTFDVIEVDGVPAGRLYVARWDEEIRIIDIALLPEHRGRGIGTALLTALLDEAAEAGKRLSIHVELNNPARRLYDRLGFTPVEERGLYLLMEAAPQSS
jgi:ribosomal protein S18 acetylase RimI-like enzyme